MYENLIEVFTKVGRLKAGAERVKEATSPELQHGRMIICFAIFHPAAISIFVLPPHQPVTAVVH
jgi:hypothetical protein